MLVTFQGKDCAGVLMFGDVAGQMMKILGKDATERGVITVEELPAAIARLKTAIAADPGPAQQTSADDGDEGPPVGLAQRALPLLALMEHSLANEGPVLWGI